MPVALKAVWTVQAGVIPGTPESELTRQWNYTSADYDKDCRENTLPAQDQAVSIYLRMEAEASAYAASLRDPRQWNWVELRWMWL